MKEEDNLNVIHLDEVNEEERALLLAKDKVYGMVERPCPWCSGMTLMEDTYGYEKVIYCTHCEYSATKTI